MSKKSRRTFIYAITNPVTEQVVYVGKTDHLVRRWNHHLYGVEKLGRYRRHTDGLYQAMVDMGKDRIMPSLRVLQVCDTDEAAIVAERKWTVALLEKGHPLKNKKNLELSKSDKLRAMAVSVKLIHLAEVAAELLEARDDDASQRVSRLIRRSLGNVDELLETY